MKTFSSLRILLLSTAILLTLPVVVQAQYTYTVSNGKTTITGYTGTGGVVNIPGTLGGGTVTSIGAPGFQSCANITSVSIPGTVTNIAGAAFFGCTGLTSITIPASVTSIGSSGFRGCTSLTSISIPANVTSIEDYEFLYCSSLTNVAFPASVTNIGQSAFSGCTSLTGVTIPTNITSIRFGVFSQTGLTSIMIPTNVTSIGQQAFSGCIRLTDLTIPNSITNIGQAAFSGCTNLNTVVIGTGVTNIGQSAFYNCASLTSVTISASVTSIGGYAFSGCTSLTSISIPASVSNIGGYVFFGCTNLMAVFFNGNAPSFGGLDFYEDNATIYYILGTTNWTNPWDGLSTVGEAAITVAGTPSQGGSVTGGGFCLVGTNIQLTAIAANGWIFADWSDGVTNNPRVVTVATNSTFIANFTAQYTWTTNYGSITITGYTGSGGVVTIPSTVNGIPVTSIDDNAFLDCTGLTSITIPSGVTNIGNYAFFTCANLTNAYFYGNAPNLGSYVFFGDPVIAYYVPGNTGWDTFTGCAATPNPNYLHLAVNNGAGGGYYTNGQVVAITAVVSNGYPFACWIGATQYLASVTSSTTTVTMPSSNIAVSATYFGQPTFTVVSGYGFPVPYVGSQTNVYGTILTCSVNSPVPGGATQYVCTGWSMTGNDPAYGTATNFTMTLTNDATLTWNWQTQYLLATTTNGNGSVTAGGWFNAGSNVTVTATPAVNYYFTGWSGDTNGCVLAGAVANSPMTQARNLVAHFALVQKTLTVVSSHGGSSPGTTVDYGTGISLWVTNSPVLNGTTQYVCMGASVAGNAFTQNSPTNIILTLTNTAMLTWNWQTQYLLTTSTNGSGSVTTGGWCNAGSNVTLTATPAATWSFAGWYGDTNGVVVANNVVTTAMTQARSLQATFVQFTFTSDGSSITITGYTGVGGEVVIPSTIYGLPVTSIAGYAFLGSSSLTGVIIPASVSSIGNYAFFNCSNLSNVFFRGNAPSLGTSVFAGGTPAIVYYPPNTTGWGSFAGPTPVLWNPTAKPDATFGIQANCFGFTITNAGSPTIVVDACTNLAGGVWIPVSTNILTSGSSYFSDPAWTNYSGRFYRFRSP